MVQICCVDGCDDRKEDIIYFKFPNSRTLRKKWLDAFTPLGKVTLDSVVCSQHFLGHEYELVRGKRRLKAKVVPSIFQKLQKTPQSSEQNENSDSKEETIKEEKKEEEKEDNEAPKENIDKQETVDPVREEKLKRSKRRKGKVKNTVSKRDEDESLVIRTEPKHVNDSEEKDIEDILINYHIKQIKPLQAEPSETNGISVSNDIQGINGEMGGGGSGEIENNGGKGEIVDNRETEEMETDVIDVDNLKDPVFIEVSVDKGNPGQPSDCLMLLESVQCEVDPGTLMLHEEPDVDLVSDNEDRKEDPISLLTSSDEDEVIIEEPYIETVEVSDETDEDDVPLVKLVDKPLKSKSSKSKKSAKSKKREKSRKLTWENFDYYCAECNYRTMSKEEYREHLERHTTVIQMCQMCGWTTASKAQFARHKRKHQDEKKYKCHLCEYKAKHNMSLIYHLKSHERVRLLGTNFGFKCSNCGFQSSVKSAVLKHMRLCTMVCKRFICDLCSYATNRKSDFTRHRSRKHPDADDEEDDDYEPPL